MFGAKAGFQYLSRTYPVSWLDMSGSLTPPDRTCLNLWHPNRKIPFRGYNKGVHAPFTPLATPLTWKYFEPIFLELKLSLLQASLTSKLLKRDLSHPLSDPLNLQVKHFIDDLRVFVSLGDLSPRQTRHLREPPRLWWASESLYCPLLH
jgi:hypothetical protein